ncbi:MAG: putative oxidoreductase [Alphaproteobacteria bacterium MarineAlpha11_Bin1]|nr:MAG: putative oxidoreductase [Alphaproteobacteria bacterium MarineAlpha11_Bin1]|tara:strand:- start:24555 stop:25268 length:714 start_codon:yes stop_codon:yes gene_type:complete
MQLDGKTALIAGASEGVGRETALLFAAAGSTVIAVSRSANALEKLAAETDGLIRSIPGDLTDGGFVDHLSKEAGDVDILVNSAGRTAHAPFLESDPDMWRDAWELNVNALLRLSQAVARGMVERRRGHIINISSVLARQVYPLTMVYAATKHATAAITRGMRIELAEYGVRVTEIAPGLLDTGLMAQAVHPEVVAAYAKRKGKRLAAKEVATAILYAASTDPGTAPELIALNPHNQI